MKNKKGFTLVELLAVIVILAIILAIAIPSITGLIESQRRSAFESNIKMIIKGMEYKILEHSSGSTEPYTFSVTTPADIADFGGDPAQFDSFAATYDAATGIITVTEAFAKDGGKFSKCCTEEATYNSVSVGTIDGESCNVSSED